MEVPEYLCLFSGNGEFSVEVKFKGEGFVPLRKATAQEITKLINSETGAFHVAMTFDEHLFEVYKYEIDPAKKKLIIRVR